MNIEMAELGAGQGGQVFIYPGAEISLSDYCFDPNTKEVWYVEFFSVVFTALKMQVIEFNRAFLFKKPFPVFFS